MNQASVDPPPAPYEVTPGPSPVSTVQFTVCTVVLLSLCSVGRLELDPFVWGKVKPFLYYNVAFVLSIYCNMRALEGALPVFVRALTMMGLSLPL